MNELMNMDFEGHGVRMLMIDSEPWWIGKDVAEVLGYSNSRKAIQDHVDAEDKLDGVTIRDSIGRDQQPILINESGVYALVFSSKLEEAKRFKRWVTHEVLPQIRKTGAYGQPIKLSVKDASTVLEGLKPLAAVDPQTYATTVQKVLAAAGLEYRFTRPRRRGEPIKIHLDPAPDTDLDSVEVFARHIKTSLVGVSTRKIYHDYIAFCNENHYEPESRIQLTRRIGQIFGYESRRTTIKGVTTSVFRTK